MQPPYGACEAVVNERDTVAKTKEREYVLKESKEMMAVLSCRQDASFQEGMV